MTIDTTLQQTHTITFLSPKLFNPNSVLMISLGGRDQDKTQNIKAFTNKTILSQTLTEARPRTMEEVWKDINLTSKDQDFSISTTTLNPRPQTHQNPNFVFQDFLNTPVNRNPSTNLTMVPTYGSFPAAPAPPPTALNLNSCSMFEFLDGRPDHSVIRANDFQVETSKLSSHEAFVASSGLGCYGKKRVQESDESSDDRKHKRMIKNRESAARSRARKQAYTYELELENAHLMEENARLKRQQLCFEASSQPPKKRSLQRTTTAPF